MSLKSLELPCRDAQWRSRSVGRGRILTQADAHLFTEHLKACSEPTSWYFSEVFLSGPWTISTSPELGDGSLSLGVLLFRGIIAYAACSKLKNSYTRECVLKQNRGKNHHWVSKLQLIRATLEKHSLLSTPSPWPRYSLE
jgi:hypothetical protein